MQSMARLLLSLAVGLAALAVHATTAGAVPGDADDDQVPDAADLCPEYASTAEHGCPIVERIGFDGRPDVEAGSGRRKGQFSAFLAGGCNGEVYVRVFESRKGRDRYVGRDYTMSGSADGYFSVAGRMPKGTYYVRVRRKVEGERRLCPAFRSRGYRAR